MTLAGRQCVPCRGGIPPLTPDQAASLLGQVPGWELTDHATRLSRRYTFKDFSQAQAFANSVGALCERENHHAVISYSWGWCTVVFYTHKIGGLHENDFIMAAKVSEMS